MGNVSLYAVNMCHYHWLIKKLIWPIARQNRVRWEIKQRYREIKDGVREMPIVAREARCEVKKPEASW